MRVFEAIILAGGLGTRLRELVSDVPKPMAVVAGNPFVLYLMRYLRHYGIRRIVLSVGYKAEVIEDYFGSSFEGLTLLYAKETVRLGTGGGIRLAMEMCRDKDVLVVNGDSFFDVNLLLLWGHHSATGADATLALREVADVSRYGSVDLDGTRIARFSEKSDAREGSGLINGGLYVLDRAMFLKHTPADAPFSAETDFFAPNCRIWNFQAIVSGGYFIDIGIPEDYHRAQNEFADFPY